ncbi:MAG: BBP7 family outer membrane beta-barrel protein [Planctomycetes bacterium]|nr:BBP7 family outer membrane beta-barrel protein [Planctomycetota bacterium]MBL7038967.1 BBP7 family outer membrane beta-barrel protein [Pirellulaceae bacterium]
MSSIRTIFTLGTIVLAVAAFQSQAAGQAVPSDTTPFQAAEGNSAFFGYAGFVGDERADTSIPSPSPKTVVHQAATPSFTSYLDDEGPSAPGLVEAESKSFDDSCGVGKLGCDDKYCDSGCDSGFGPTLYDPWVTIEYMHAWARGRWLPPLVTTSPPGVDGVLPGSSILFGDEYVGSGLQASGRVSFGAWLDDEQSVAMGGRMFALEGDSTDFAAASDILGSPLISRPFFNTDPLVPPPPEDSLRVTLPAFRSGDLRATADNDVLGVEAFLRYSLHRCENRRVDLWAGYHFTKIDDRLNINHRMLQFAGPLAGTVFTFEDIFDVKNEFHGGELGLLSEVDRGPFTVSLMGKLSMGNMRETLTISGFSSRIPPAGGFHPGHGLLAMPTNVGTYVRDDFAIIPEAEFKVICRITKRLEASLGYSFVYWSDVALAGQQIDMSMGQPTVNASQLLGGALAGPPNPAFTGIVDTDFWIQALSFGLTFKL